MIAGTLAQIINAVVEFFRLAPQTSVETDRDRSRIVARSRFGHWQSQCRAHLSALRSTMAAAWPRLAEWPRALWRHLAAWKS